MRYLNNPSDILPFCYHYELMSIWVNVFKNGSSKICGRQPLKDFNYFILEYFDSFKVQQLT